MVKRLSVWMLLKTILIILLAIFFIYPIFYTAVSALRTLEEFSTLPPYAMPQSLYLDNYTYVIHESNIPLYFLNSFIITFFVVILVLVLSSMTAFAISKMRYRFKKPLLIYFLLGLMVPMHVCLLPLYLTFSSLKITNTYLGVIIPCVAFGLPLSIYLSVNFYRFLPNDILEAGIIDGCSTIRLFVQVVVPMSRNILITLAIMRAVFCWNDFIFPYTFTNSKSMQTVTLGLQDFVGAYGYTDWGKTFATITMTVLPTLLIYFFLGKYMVAGLSEGAVKG